MLYHMQDGLDLLQVKEILIQIILTILFTYLFLLLCSGFILLSCCYLSSWIFYV